MRRDHGEHAHADHGHAAAGPEHAPTNSWGARVKAAATWPLRIYQRYLSPLKGAPSCRFHPTCSSYAIEAIEVHGVLRGSWMGLLRVLRCHPFHPGGFDPVPPKRTRRGAHGRGYESKALESPDVSTEAP